MTIIKLFALLIFNFMILYFTDKPLSRHSSSISGDSCEVYDTNIRFVSPESKRRLRQDRYVILGWVLCYKQDAFLLYQQLNLWFFLKSF